VCNRYTYSELLVGSECILKFGIRALVDGDEILTQAGTRRLLQKDRRKLIVDAQAKRVINALLLLGNAAANFDFENFITYFQERRAFTPSQLSLLLWRLDANSIPYDKHDFPMIIRRDREKVQLRNMPQWKVKKMWECMSASQRQWYVRDVGNRV
jgi:hypothetical protein